MTQTVPEKDHFITANEGNAVAMCTGYHLATGRTGLVYLQVGRDVWGLTPCCQRLGPREWGATGTADVPQGNRPEKFPVRTKTICRLFGGWVAQLAEL